MHPNFSQCTAIAAVLLASAAAQAQPATTDGIQLYGLMDTALGRFAGSASGINTASVAQSKIEGGGMSTSHWGVRGNENLGHAIDGGLIASFELSSFFRSDTGSVGRSDAFSATIAADPLFSRAAWVGLSSPTLGRLRLGNATSQLFIQTIGSNAFGDSMTFGPLNLVTFTGGVLSGGTSWTNSVIYDTPQWNGFTANFVRSLSEGNAGGGNSAVRASYAQGPLTTALVWQGVKKDPSTFADGTTSNDTATWQLAATYDFTVVKLFAHVGAIKNKGTAAAPAHIGYRVWDISASVPLGAGRVLAGYASRKTGDTVGPVPAAVPGGNVQRNILSLGYDYSLSKRTNVYAIAMHDSTHTRTLTTTAPAILAASGNSVGFGIRHRF